MTKKQSKGNRHRIITAITILAASLLLPYAANSLAATPEIETVFVKGGCFPMGDTFRVGKDYEQPVHEVCVSDFFIGKYEVTQEQWEAVMGSNPSKFPGGRMPVDTVSWDDTQTFIAKLNQMTGKRYRLPTEAEWEYAARSGGKKENWAGTSDESQVGEYAWYKANAGERTHVVGTKRPNGLGICDMSGNVWEWVQDRYGVGVPYSYYTASPKDNPQGSGMGNQRMLRGGSWNFDAWYSRASSRLRIDQWFRDRDVGFRLASPSR